MPRAPKKGYGAQGETDEDCAIIIKKVDGVLQNPLQR